MKKLTRKEKLFCLYYAQDRNGREAAAKAGYLSPQEASAHLLERKDIRDAITENTSMTETAAAEIRAGYRKLAFGSGADALRLLFDEVPPEDLDRLDLFNVSEIKKPKDGALEIKFFDRLRALEHLQQFEDAGKTDPALPLYEALRRSVPQPDENDGR